MGLPVEVAIRRLSATEPYPRLFPAAFGQQPSATGLAQALASYVRTILAGNSPYDRYVHGSSDSLSKPARRGLRVFATKARCANCHLGPNLTDEEFHNTGVAWINGEPTDEGRFAVTGVPEDLGAFKTPTLRQVAQTAPYMHDGRLRTLAEVVEFYDRGGGHGNPWLDSGIQPLDLTPQEKEDLIEFLRALTGTVREGW